MNAVKSLHIKTFLITALCIAVTSLQLKHSLTAEISPEKFSLKTKTESTWQDFGKYLEPINLQEEKRAMIVEITFRSKKALKLKGITLQWTGDQINNDIDASLFKKKDSRDDLKLIESNVVGDGKWDSTKQQLSFEVDEKLIAINKYYLILHFSPEIEAKLKSGQFVISQKQPIRVYSFR